MNFGWRRWYCYLPFYLFYDLEFGEKRMREEEVFVFYYTTSGNVGLVSWFYITTCQLSFAFFLSHFQKELLMKIIILLPRKSSLYFWRSQHWFNYLSDFLLLLGRGQDPDKGYSYSGCGCPSATLIPQTL